MTEGDLLPLIECVYDAATRPEAWNDVLSLLCETSGADVGIFYIYDSRSTRGNAVWWRGTPDEAVLEFPAWAGKMPHLSRVSMTTGTVMGNTPVSRTDYFRSEYFNDYMRRHIELYASSGCVVYGDGSRHVVMAADRIARREEFDPSHARLLRLMLPHLQRATMVYQRLADAELERSGAFAALNRLDCGVVLLSDRGEVLAMNDVAGVMIGETPLMSLTAEGRPVATRAADRNVLDRLVSSACSGPTLRAAGGALRLEGDEDDGLAIFVLPLRLREFALSTRRPSAVMFLHDPARPATPLARIQQLFGLTEGEGRFAQLLIAGLSIREAADELQIGVATARTYVRRLLQKTRSRSISDLTRRLAALPALR